jgi:hypothetical protein
VGEHTREILEELSIDAGTLATLVASGIVSVAR